MPPYTSPGERCRRDDLQTAKRQTVFLVALLTTSFSLWPTRYIFVRDALIVFFLSWITAKVFDLAAFLDGTWESVPYWVKMLSPVDPDIQIPAPFDYVKSAGGNVKLRWVAPVVKYSLEKMLAIVVGLLDWFLGQDSKNPLDIEPPPGRDHWVALLVATPPEYDYYRINTTYEKVAEADLSASQLIEWDSFEDVPTTPSIAALPAYRDHLSICLIHREDWDDEDARIVDKFKSGRYWTMGADDGEDDGTPWSEQRVRTIQAVEVLGFLSKTSKAVSICRERTLSTSKQVSLPPSPVSPSPPPGFRPPRPKHSATFPNYAPTKPSFPPTTPPLAGAWPS